jgi:hypothetical protein
MCVISFSSESFPFTFSSSLAYKGFVEGKRFYPTKLNSRYIAEVVLAIFKIEVVASIIPRAQSSLLRLDCQQTMFNESGRVKLEE